MKKSLYIQEPNKEGFQYATIGGNILAYKRHGNDINGNPLYKVLPITFLFRRYKDAYRNYEKSNGKSYYLLQSYNIKDDLIKFLETMDKLAPMKLNIEKLDGWRNL